MELFLFILFLDFILYLSLILIKISFYAVIVNLHIFLKLSIFFPHEFVKTLRNMRLLIKKPKPCTKLHCYRAIHKFVLIFEFIYSPYADRYILLSKLHILFIFTFILLYIISNKFVIHVKLI